MMNTEQHPHLIAVPAAKSRVKTNPVPKLITISELMKLPDQEWLIEGLLPAQGLCLIYGEPGGGKSFVALDLACRVAMGVSWQGRQCRTGDVIYLAAEGTAGLKKRMRTAIQSEPRIIESGLYFWPIAPDFFKDTENLIERINEHRAQNDIALVIIDTLSRTFGGRNENAPEDMSLYVNLADQIKKSSGGTLLLVHHSGKDSSRGARGHTSLLGAADAVIEIKRTTSCRVLAVKKQKDGEEIPPCEFTLRQLGESCAVEWGGEATMTERPATPWGNQQKTIHNLFCIMAEENPTFHPSAPQGRPVVVLDELFKRWRAATDGKKARSNFDRAMNAMLKKQIFGNDEGDEGFVWLL